MDRGESSRGSVKMEHPNSSKPNPSRYLNEDEEDKSSGGRRIDNSLEEVRRTGCEGLLRENGFREIELLGKGAFGVVFKATDKDGKVVAVKVPQRTHIHHFLCN